LPTGSAFSCVAPAIGLLMLAKVPPLAWSQVQTFGGMYSVVFVMIVLRGGAVELAQAP
jgi:hypothetical protein